MRYALAFSVGFAFVVHGSRFDFFCCSYSFPFLSITRTPGMYICSQSGELVHPIHLQHLVEEEQEHAMEEDDDAEETEGTSPPLERGAPVHSAR